MNAKEDEPEMKAADANDNGKSDSVDVVLDVQKRVGSLEEDISGQEEEMDTDTWNGLEKRLSRLEQKASREEEDFSGQEQRVGGLEGDIFMLKKSIDKAAGDIAELTDRIAGLTDRTSSMEQRVTNHHDRLDRLEQRLAEVKGKPMDPDKLKRLAQVRKRIEERRARRRQNQAK